MAAWDEWIQDVAGTVIKQAGQAEYVYPYQIQSQQMQQLGQLGFYTEGYPGTVAPGQSQGLAVSPSLLLLGGVLLVAMMVLGD